MTRRTFRAVVTDNSGNEIIGERTTFAWNSAIRATEAILREFGRERVGALHGGKPVVMDDIPYAGQQTGDRIYRRIWTTATGREYRALVWEVV